MKLGLAVYVLIAAAYAATAGELRPLPTESQGRYGATHYVELSAGSTFDGFATNVVYTNTYTVPASSALLFAGFELLQPWVGTASGKVLSDATVTLGTEADDTAFLSATQISTNGVTWWSAPAPAITLTLLKGDVKSVIDGVTNTYSVVTGATAAASVETSFATATNLVLKVTPSSGQSLDWAERGRFRLFFQKRESYGR